ncbi:MAG: ThiJ/PfpI domain protein [Myxococcales bacterium]|nr:ThiJ/PfpI domain protein [Myxococcales bacterium]
MVKIPIVVSTVGYHWEELYGAYDEFKKAGFEIDLFTVDGTPPRADPMSLRRTGPLSLFGLGMAGSIAPSTPRGREIEAALATVRPVAELEPADYEAIYLPGGHGCLFDVNRNEGLHAKIAELYETNRILSAVCHATSTFALVRVDGHSIAAGKQLTGFPQLLDDVLIPAGAVDKSFLPLPLSNERVLRQEGVDLPALDPLRGAMNPRHMCVSLPFITGVGPKSARPVARAVIGELRARSQRAAAA